MLIGGSVLFFLTRAWIFPTNLELPAWIIIAVIVIIGTAVGFSVFLESVKSIGPVKSTLLWLSGTCIGNVCRKRKKMENCLQKK